MKVFGKFPESKSFNAKNELIELFQATIQTTSLNHEGNELGIVKYIEVLKYKFEVAIRRNVK